jgi:hypothetical protein
VIATLASGALLAGFLPGWRAFRAALDDPRRAQEAVLRRIVAADAGTAYLRAHGLAPGASPATFLDRVPPVAYDALAPWIARAAAGEPHVLCDAPVRRFQPSSGSAAATKLVPYPVPLAAAFRRALAPWLADLFLRTPALLGGPAYWSVSPAAARPGRTAAGIPVGFEDDAEYLGGVGRRLVEATLAVPSAVARLLDVEAWRERTLVHLLRAPGLRLVSVWSPSFLALLLAPLATRHDALVRAVRDGAPAVAGLPALPPDPARARALAAAGPDPARIWPRLRVVSAWADGPSAPEAARLAARLPGVALQPKGLVATEAIVSIPFGGARPAAIRSHFLELELPGRGLVPLHAWREGDEGAVVVTTGGGLHRYRLGDGVAVTGFLRRTPCLAFLGKADLVSDRFGEKLHDAFVAAALAALRAEGALGEGLAFLAPETPPQAAAAARPGYALFCAAPRAHDLAARLERRLGEAFHYAHCVRLGQLAPARVYAVEGDALEAWHAALHARGRRLGDVKPAALSRENGWSSLLPGRFVG